MPQSSWDHDRPPSEACDGCPNPNPVAAAPAVDVSGALLLVLGYLRLPELLAFQGVSRLFRDAVSLDSLLWRRVAIERPLSLRLTDEALVRITSRAGGKLEALALLDCWKVTDDGLMQVVNRNRGITKLHVPGCTQLSADGVVRILKWHYELKGRLKSLQIHGIPNLTIYHLDALKLLFKNDVLQVSYPINYNNRPSNIFNSDRPIDVDICPKCSNVRIVFDCTRENCRLYFHSCSIEGLGSHNGENAEVVSFALQGAKTVEVVLIFQNSVKKLSALTFSARHVGFICQNATSAIVHIAIGIRISLKVLPSFLVSCVGNVWSPLAHRINLTVVNC
ncbi:hypothetical protein ZIOFF_062191 [Zingiber officinale]|uniref:F-box domain-containing protein n=1 Tax=Zingiber officinale TaxID=94328 RepID=A0A8J5F015_ZINOF|nr:hypothetical protein ZIOFF_062191 [Zingiber officinale]